MQTRPHFSLLATSFAGGPRPRNAALILAGLWLLLFVAALFSPPILDDADATHAEAAQSMAHTGDFVTLHVDGVRYLEKAPLIYWVVALSFRIFGFNTFAAHLPQALAVLLLMLLGHRWANQAFGSRTGFYTALGILTSAGVFLFTRILIPEVALSLFLAAALFAFLKSLGPIASPDDDTPIHTPGVPAPTTSIRGPIFASPQLHPINLEEALRTTGGPDVELFIATARRIEDQHSVRMSHVAATGIWNGGAAPSVISRSESPLDLETLNAIAAIRGRAANQEAVLTWHDHDDGPHTRYVIDLRGVSANEAASRVLLAGFEHATIEATSDGSEIHLIGLSIFPAMRFDIERKLNEHFSDGVIHDQHGFGRLLCDQRQHRAFDEPQWTYDQVLQDYAGRSRNPSPQGASGFHDRTAGKIHAEKSQLGADQRTAFLLRQSFPPAPPLTPERPAIAFYAGPNFYPHVMWASLACAVLTKGLVALVFFFASTLLYLLLLGEARQSLKKLRPLTGILLFLAIAAPWHVLAALRNPATNEHHGFLWFYFWNEHVLRFLGRRLPADYNKLPGPLYWALNLVWLFPWTLFLPLAFAALWRRFRHQVGVLARRTDLTGVAGIATAVLAGLVAFLSNLISGSDLFTMSILCAALMVAVEVGIRRFFTRIPISPFHRIDPQQRTILLLSLFAAIVLLFFSVSTNQEYYTFPVYLPILLLLAATVSRAEQAFSSDASARRWITVAHASFTFLGVVIALVLLYGLWSSRHLPYTLDIGTLLAHRNAAGYTLSMSHFLDLTPATFAVLRLPAALAAVVFLVGPAFAWLLRQQRRHLAATSAIAFTSAGFLFAAHLALARFAPLLSSQNFADRIQSLERSGKIAPDTQIAIFGDQAFGSSIPFYLDRPVFLIDGRTTSMQFGSTFPDALPIFLTSREWQSTWGRGSRKILFVPPARRAEVTRLLGPERFPLAESSGKVLLTDRPLAP